MCCLAVSIKKGVATTFLRDYFLCHTVLSHIFIFVLQHHRKLLFPSYNTVQCVLDQTALNIRPHLIFWPILTQSSWNLSSPSLHGKAEVLWVWTCNVLMVQGVITHMVQQTHTGMCIDQQFGTWPTLPNGCEMFHKMQSSISNVNTKFTWHQELLCANYRIDSLVLWMYLIILFSHLVSES